MKLLGAISLMSAPAAKALSLPVTIMTLIAESFSKSSTARVISSISAWHSAFRACGRLRVMMPVLPRFSTMMFSKVMGLFPWGEVEMDGDKAIFLRDVEGQRFVVAAVCGGGQRLPAHRGQGFGVNPADLRFGSPAFRHRFDNPSARLVENNGVSGFFDHPRHQGQVFDD